MKVYLEAFQDSRGSFARLFDANWEFLDQLNFSAVNVNLSFNPDVNTLRGFHYSVGKPEEHKLIVCLTGAIFNVSVDLRPSSRTFMGISKNIFRHGDLKALLIPSGCANAWITQEPNTSLVYFTSCRYDPPRERGIRFDDEVLKVDWPSQPEKISDKDASWPSLASQRIVG